MKIQIADAKTIFSFFVQSEKAHFLMFSLTHEVYKKNITGASASQ